MAADIAAVCIAAGAAAVRIVAVDVVHIAAAAAVVHIVAVAVVCIAAVAAVRIAAAVVCIAAVVRIAPVVFGNFSVVLCMLCYRQAVGGHSRG